MSKIIHYGGAYVITFPNGSVIKGCKRRSYDSGTLEWYVFYGRQFQRKELDRWGAVVAKEVSTADETADVTRKGRSLDE